MLFLLVVAAAQACVPIADMELELLMPAALLKRSVYELQNVDVALMSNAGALRSREALPLLHPEAEQKCKTNRDRAAAAERARDRALQQRALLETLRIEYPLLGPDLDRYSAALERLAAQDPEALRAHLQVVLDWRAKLPAAAFFKLGSDLSVPVRDSSGNPFQMGPEELAAARALLAQRVQDQAMLADDLAFVGLISPIEASAWWSVAARLSPDDRWTWIQAGHAALVRGEDPSAAFATARSLAQGEEELAFTLYHEAILMAEWEPSPSVLALVEEALAYYEGTDRLRERLHLSLLYTRLTGSDPQNRLIGVMELLLDKNPGDPIFSTYYYTLNPGQAEGWQEPTRLVQVEQRVRAYEAIYSAGERSRLVDMEFGRVAWAAQQDPEEGRRLYAALMQRYTEGISAQRAIVEAMYLENRQKAWPEVEALAWRMMKFPDVADVGAVYVLNTYLERNYTEKIYSFCDTYLKTKATPKPTSMLVESCARMAERLQNPAAALRYARLGLELPDDSFKGSGLARGDLERLVARLEKKVNGG